MAGSVLDSFALLAYLRDEPGANEVEKLLVSAAQTNRSLMMTEVNFAEVKYITLRKNGAAAWKHAADLLKSYPIEFHPADRQLSELAADFKVKHRISLADAFAAALAKVKRATLVTGDAEFKALEKEVKLSWIK